MRISKTGMLQQKPLGLCWIGTSQWEWPEEDKIQGNVPCCASLNEVKIGEDARPIKCCTARYTSALSLSSHCPSSPTYNSPNIRSPLMVLVSVKHHVSLHHRTQPAISTSVFTTNNWIESNLRKQEFILGYIFKSLCVCNFPQLHRMGYLEGKLGLYGRCQKKRWRPR